MDAINTTHELYQIKFKVDNQCSPNNDNKSLDDDIQRHLSIAVKSISSTSKLFRNSCIFDSLIIALQKCVANESGVTPLVTAYTHLEKYFLLLVRQPWKPEYRTLKTYGGFYKTKIKSVIHSAEIIFMSAGYDLNEDNTMVYKSKDVDKHGLLILSFDCFVATDVCKRIAERHNRLKSVGQTLDDAISEILKSWPKDRAKDKILTNYKSLSKLMETPELPKRAPVRSSSGNAKVSSKTVIFPTEPSPVYDANIGNQNPEVSLGNFKYKSNTDPHIPFMDEEAERYPKLSQATPEEHMRESLKLVKEQQESKSDEWKYYYGQDALPKSSHPLSNITYPPGYNGALPLQQNSQWNHQLETAPNMKYSKDEGIVPDLRFPVKPSLMTPALDKSVYSDQGYGTGTTYSTPILISSGQEIMSDTIYRPPDINSEGNIISKAPLTKNSSMPPPRIPPRYLKPTYRATDRIEDVVDGRIGVTRSDNSTSAHSNNAAVPTSLQKPVGPTGALNIGSDLRPPRSSLQVKSSSLRTESKKLVGDNRVVKSMDYSYNNWKCPICEFSNGSLTMDCLRCSFKRTSGSNKEEPKKTCSTCTFDNHWNATRCEMCEKDFSQ